MFVKILSDFSVLRLGDMSLKPYHLFDLKCPLKIFMNELMINPYSDMLKFTQDLKNNSKNSL